MFIPPSEKKFSFLNPDELAKMKEEEGKSALRIDFSWHSIHSFLQRKNGVTSTRCTLATVSFLQDSFFCHLWLSFTIYVFVISLALREYYRQGNTFLDLLIEHLWLFPSIVSFLFLSHISYVPFAERRIASMTKMEFERMASEAQLKADEEAEAALESVDQIEGVLRRPSQIGNQGNTRT